MFNVTKRYADKLIPLRRENDDLTPTRHGGLGIAKLDGEERALNPAELFAAQTDTNMKELCLLIDRRPRGKVP